MNGQLLQVFSLAGLLGIINLDFLRPVLEKYYGESWRWKKFDCIAMLRLTIFRIIKRKNRCGIIRYLKLFPEQAVLLGFGKKLPSPKTIWHWEKIRLGLKGFRELFNETVWNIKAMLRAAGIVLAKFLCVDSTPIQACRNDKDEFAQFNPHYGLFMYKGDTACCSETGIPVDFGIDGGTNFDGHKLPEVYKRIKELLKQIIEGVIGDCHYNTFDNHAFAYLNNFKLICSFPENAVFDEKGTTENLMEKYKEFWQDGEYIPPPVNFLHVLRMLSRLEPELVGRYFKNQAFQIKDSQDYKKLRGRRSLIENEHSVVKERTSLARLRSKGKENAELELAMSLLAILITSPLFLLQRGESKNLMRINHYEP
ncbi:transposase [Candidatus Woesearchaeota archaeon]|nr:transposase [Candidatus Woesearchaeota archaeon]